MSDSIPKCFRGKTDDAALKTWNTLLRAKWTQFVEKELPNMKSSDYKCTDAYNVVFIDEVMSNEWDNKTIVKVLGSLSVILPYMSLEQRDKDLLEALLYLAFKSGSFNEFQESVQKKWMEFAPDDEETRDRLLLYVKHLSEYSFEVFTDEYGYELISNVFITTKDEKDYMKKLNRAKAVLASMIF